MSAPLLLLVIFDGLGHELIQGHYRSFGNISKFYDASPKIGRGVTPVFPTITTPNLMSVATGLYSESHGITANDMKAHSHELDKYNLPEFHLFSASDTDTTWWDNGLNMPIWTLNELASTTARPRYSGGMLWAGSGAPYQNKTITYYHAYEENISWYRQVDIVMEWFTDPEKSANCIVLYFAEPDVALHAFGPESKKFVAILQRVNDVVGYLMNKVETHNLKDSLNVIVTADHGMADVPAEHYNEIDELNIPKDWYRVNQNSVTWDINPLPGYFEKVYEAFYEGSIHMNYSVWKIEDFPESAHFKRASHVPPIQLVTDVGFRTVFRKENVSSTLGWHGYNNTDFTMHTFFLAQGPAFNSSAVLESFVIVDLYPLMCHILELTPHPNNGSFERVATILSSIKNSEGSYIAHLLLVGISAVNLLLLRVCCKRKSLPSKRKLLQEGIIGASSSVKDFKKMI